MTREKRLGRGLEALLGRAPGKEDAASGSSASPLEERSRSASGSRDGVREEPAGAFAGSYGRDAVELRAAETPAPGAILGAPRVAIARIDRNPFQPRQEFDEEEIRALSESLQSHGLLQPVVVRRVGERYQLVAGERRLRAAAQAGWKDVPVQVIEADDRQLAELAIVENLHRKDLGALEKAASFQRYLQQYGCTQEELASRLKLDRSTISNLIRLLELPQSVQQALREGKITQGHARSLLPLGDEREQVAFCTRIQTEGLSVRQTETMVQEMIAREDEESLGLVDRDGSATPARRVTSEHVAALEQDFRAALGMRVKLTHNARGRGKLVIQFSGHEEFERLRAHLCGAVQPQTRNQAG